MVSRLVPLTQHQLSKRWHEDLRLILREVVLCLCGPLAIALVLDHLQWFKSSSLWIAFTYLCFMAVFFIAARMGSGPVLSCESSELDRHEHALLMDMAAAHPDIAAFLEDIHALGRTPVRHDYWQACDHVGNLEVSRLRRQRQAMA